MPALEAMMLGAPVLTSTASSLPEVVGEAAIKVDPYKVGEIADALRRLDGDEGLRNSLSQAGKARAAEYDMASYQQRLADMYAQVMR